MNDATKSPTKVKGDRGCQQSAVRVVFVPKRCESREGHGARVGVWGAGDGRIVGASITSISSSSASVKIPRYDVTPIHSPSSGLCTGADVGLVCTASSLARLIRADFAGGGTTSAPPLLLPLPLPLPLPPQHVSSTRRSPSEVAVRLLSALGRVRSFPTAVAAETAIVSRMPLSAAFIAPIGSEASASSVQLGLLLPPALPLRLEPTATSRGSAALSSCGPDTGAPCSSVVGFTAAPSTPLERCVTSGVVLVPVGKCGVSSVGGAIGAWIGLEFAAARRSCAAFQV